MRKQKRITINDPGTQSRKRERKFGDIVQHKLITKKQLRVASRRN